MHWWAGSEISSTWGLTRTTEKPFVVAALLPPLPAWDVLLACAEDRHSIGDNRPAESDRIVDHDAKGLGHPRRQAGELAGRLCRRVRLLSGDCLGLVRADQCAAREGRYLPAHGGRTDAHGRFHPGGRVRVSMFTIAPG